MECTIRETPENARRRKMQEAHMQQQKEREKSMSAFKWILRQEVEKLIKKYGGAAVQQAAQALIKSGYKITSPLRYANAIEDKIQNA